MMRPTLGCKKYNSASVAGLGLRRKVVAVMTATILAVGGVAGNAYAQGQYYRYINEEGVKVLGHSIPPKYVINGYEILSANGRVIEVVEPAPDPELVEAARAKAELKVRYELLARRYSTVRDIEAAKQRKLIHVDASVLLVESSINNIQEEIDDITTRAANSERAGKAVPQNILDTLAALNEKMSATQAIREQRIAEKKAIEDRFLAEKQLFTEGVESFDPNAADKLQADESGAGAKLEELEDSSVKERNTFQQSLSGA